MISRRPEGTPLAVVVHVTRLFQLAVLGVWVALLSPGAAARTILLQRPASDPVAATAKNGSTRVLFVNIHTKERMVIDPNRLPTPSAINRFLRCRKDRVYTLIDPRPLHKVAQVALEYGKHYVEVVSGFRSPEFNASMRPTKKNNPNYSFHIRGQALDFRIRGVPMKTLCKHFRKLRMGGVGCYKKNQFIHLDTGPVRIWDQ